MALGKWQYVIEADKQWMKERFRTVLHDILKDSWVYQERLAECSEMGIKAGREDGIKTGREEGKEERREEGRKEELEQVIIQFVEIRFSTLLALAKQAIEQKTLQQLEKMLSGLYRASTIEEAQVVLLTNG